MSNRITRGRMSEPSSWGGVGGLLLMFSSAPASIIPGLDGVVIPWQLRVGAFALAVVCFVVQVSMREWPNK